MCFRFGIFWFCIAIFIGIMCLVNRYNKKKSQVDILQFTCKAHLSSISFSFFFHCITLVAYLFAKLFLLNLYYLWKASSNMSRAYQVCAWLGVIRYLAALLTKVFFSCYGGDMVVGHESSYKIDDFSEINLSRFASVVEETKRYKQKTRDRPDKTANNWLRWCIMHVFPDCTR